MCRAPPPSSFPAASPDQSPPSQPDGPSRSPLTGQNTGVWAPGELFVAGGTRDVIELWGCQTSAGRAILLPATDTSP
ncbi:unnamed protein product [Gadus morhua 'NCC']